MKWWGSTILLIPVIYDLISLCLLRRFRDRRDPVPRSFPPVSILKPLKGGDGRTFDNLSTVAELDYPIYQIVLVVASPDDPAVPLARRLIREFPHREISLVIDSTIHGANPKVSSLINAFEHCRHDIIALSDADVRLDADYLARVAGWFDDPSVGLVTSLYRHPDPVGLAGNLESLILDTEMIPNVIVAERVEGMTFALGASMVVRRSVLDSIGGFQALADFLADDYQLGNLIHRDGWRVVLSRATVSLSQGSETIGDFLRRHLRWGMTMRVSRPDGYLASGVTRFSVMGVAALTLSGGDPEILLTGIPLYLLHLALLSLIRLSVGGRVSLYHLLLLPLRDILSGLFWGGAFIGDRIVWRGERYRLGRDGRLEKE